MRIGLFIDTFYPMIDGVVTVVDNYARILNSYKDTEVIVFAPETGEYDDNKLPYKVVRCKSIKVPNIDYSLPLPKIDRKFLKELDKYDLDIIHIHSPATIGRVGVEYAKKHNIPLLGTIHSQFYKDFLRTTKNKLLSKKLTKYTMKLFSKCDICYTVNEGMKNVVINEYNFKKELFIMRNATTMVPIEEDNSLDKKYNINKDELVFLFVGRINKLKNIFLIVDSLSYIKDKLDFKMLFVGNGQDEKALIKEIERLNLSDRVIMCGRISDRCELAKYYKRSDLFLFPSLYDASSVVQVEAASQETPTLFIKGSATSFNIKDNHNGYLSENDYREYGERILKIVNNKEKLKEVSKNAFKELYITWDIEVKKVYDKYKELLEKNV